MLVQVNITTTFIRMTSTLIMMIILIILIMMMIIIIIIMMMMMMMMMMIWIILMRTSMTQTITTMISMKTSITTTFCSRNDKNKDIKNNIAEPCKHLAYGVSFESRNSPVHIDYFLITFHQRNMFMSCMY